MSMGENPSMEACFKNEIWRPIPGAEGYYSVSNLGRVRSEPLPFKTTGRQRGRILKLCLDTKGYPMFRLCIPGKRSRTVKVHRMVATAFLRPPGPHEQVNHKNGIKTDNHVENLEYISCKENIRHCWRNGLHTADHCAGSKNSNAKLNEDAVKAIRASYPAISARVLARQYGVTSQAINFVVKRKTWRSVA